MGGENKIQGFIFDTVADARLSSPKATKVIALEEYGFVDNKGIVEPLSGQGMSQLEAIIQADRMLRQFYASNAFTENKEPWFDILAPQLILYILSKLLRIIHLLRQLPQGLSWQVCSANGMIFPLMESIAPGMVKVQTRLHSKMVLKKFLIYRYHGLKNWQQKVFIGGKKHLFKNQLDGIKGCILFWCPNIAFEPAAIPIVEQMKRKNIPVLCVASNGLYSPLTISQFAFLDSDCQRYIKKSLPRLRSFLNKMAESMILELIGKDQDFTHQRMVRFLRRELELFFVPQAVNALELAQRALDIVEPRSVFIQDMGDCRTRAIAWAARMRQIPVFHHQQGTVTTASIEWTWNIVDKHFVWGDCSREIVSGLGIQSNKIEITGTPKIPYTPPQTGTESKTPNKPMRTLFTLMPASPLAFGNGGASSLTECQAIMNMLFKWVELMEGKLVLQIKPRPLKDHEWFDVFLPILPASVEMLPGDMSVDEALKNTDMVITTHSTIAIDSIFMGKPLVVLSRGNEPHPYAEAVHFGAAKMADSFEDLKNISEKLLFHEYERNKMINCQLKYQSRILKYAGEESAERIVSYLQQSYEDTKVNDEKWKNDRQRR